MSYLAMLARAWQRPSLAALLVAAAAGQWIRSAELVAIAHAIDEAGSAIIKGAANQAWEAVRMSDMEDYALFHRDVLSRLPGVSRINSSFAMRSHRKA